MPKQGQFARSGRIKRINNFKVKQHHQGATIRDDQLVDFLVVRYALTLKKRITSNAQETVQRFLIEISDLLISNHGNLQKIVPSLLANLASRVPWQFYWQVSVAWEKLQDFLKKELPAVPLKQQFRITKPVSVNDFNQLVANVLSHKAAAITFVKQGGQRSEQQEQTAQLLLQSIYQNNQIKWDQVAALFAPFKFPVPAELDSVSKKWLTELARTRY